LEVDMRRPLLLVLILLLVVLFAGTSSACSKDSSTETTKESGQSSTTTSTTASTSTSITSVSKPGGVPDIADMKSLPSYRLSIMTKSSEGTGSVSYMKYEYVKDQKAEHAWMEDANGKVTEVYIKIGDKYWMYMGLAGMGWMKQPPQTTTASAVSSDLASQIKELQQDVEHSKARFDKKGTETVNNVRCIRYEFEYTLVTEMPNLATGGTTKTDAHSTGEAWIADQSGLPAVMIKSKSTTDIIMSGEKTVLDMEQNLTDIGAAITINPPEGAAQIPTGTPTIPTGTPTHPPTNPTTPPTTTNTPPTTTSAPPTTTITPTVTRPAFEDNFQSDWNDKWTWIDPNDDVTYSFSAHNGFLKLTVPGDNDLAGVANYDAPRLLVPQSGDFTIETLVEYDPQETYQGAGLLIWQDENTFLRLEFGFGGMGGIEKNAVFVKQEEGALGLVGSIDLSATINRIELRLQRTGDQFSAWYRESSGTWHEIGSTELNLESIVNIGITQITQYTTSEISADFDYFKLYTP
jgi:regulation of enolase protein 1 (concanavalin A-like superfamily)